MRKDVLTGKCYTDSNIPLDRKGGALTRYEDTANNRKYRIMSESMGHSDDMWYNGRFLGDRYAVFVWVATTSTLGFWQQVTPWYIRYGYAVRMMLKKVNLYHTHNSSRLWV